MTPEYLAINPRGRVPALAVDGKVVTENTAILTWIATAFPEAGLLPDDTIERMRCIAQMAVVDPYGLVFYGWGTSNGMPMQQLASYTRHKDRMLERRTVQIVLEREKNPHIR